jgi:hypothetical protein
LKFHEPRHRDSNSATLQGDRERIVVHWSTRPVNRREPQASPFDFFPKTFGVLPGCLASEAPPAQAFISFHLTANAFIKTQKRAVI